MLLDVCAANHNFHLRPTHRLLLLVPLLWPSLPVPRRSASSHCASMGEASLIARWKLSLSGAELAGTPHARSDDSQLICLT